MLSSMQTKVFKTDGRRLFYHDEGSGRAVLILHGADLHIPGSWDKAVEALLEAGYRVVFPYRAGRGQSDPHPVFLSLARDARDMWAIVDHLDLGRVTLIGHSQGACVASDMVLKRPQDVAGVVSEDSASFGTVRNAIRNLKTLERFDAEDRTLYDKYKSTLTFLGTPWDYPSDHNVWRKLMRRAGRRADDEWKTQQIPDPEDAPIPSEGKWCNAPLLVFAAGRGRIRQNDPEAVALEKSLPAKDAKLVVVTKSGHGIHEEQPEIFNHETLAFLEKIGSGAGKKDDMK